MSGDHSDDLLAENGLPRPLPDQGRRSCKCVFGGKANRTGQKTAFAYSLFGSDCPHPWHINQAIQPVPRLAQTIRYAISSLALPAGGKPATHVICSTVLKAWRGRQHSQLPKMQSWTHASHQDMRQDRYLPSQQQGLPL